MRRAAPIVLVGSLVAALLLTGCSGSSAPEGTPGDEPSPVVATVPLGELSSAPGALAVGEEIRVIVDTPDIEWSVTSSDAAVVKLEDTGKNPGVVRLIAVAEGSAEIVFDGGTEAARDQVLLTVGTE